MRHHLFLASAILALSSGCSRASLSRGAPGDGAATESACDPLAPKPIALGAIVGVGKDAAGTLYVDSANGIFVSGNGELVRQHVIGTGQSGANAFIFTVEAPGGDASSARNLLVDTQGSTASAMALGPPDSKAFLGQSDAGVTSLAIVDSTTVSGMTVVNTPNLISYVGDVANGDVVLATVPMNADATSTDGGLSIFYGPPSGVAQRPIMAFVESLSGNGDVTFLVGNTTYVLVFGMLQGPDAGPLGTFALENLITGGDAEVGITLRSPTPTSIPSGLSFTCLP